MKTLLKLGIAIVALWLLGLAAFNCHIRHIQVDKTSKTDAIIALTGGSNRIKEAVEMLNQGFSDVLFISGVEKGVTLRQIAAAQHFKINPDKKVIIGQASTNTVENAQETMKWIKENNIKSIRLVTSNYHLPRKAQNSGVKIIANPVFSGKVAEDWWKNAGTFMLTASEYTKFLMVYAKYWAIKLIGE